MLLTRPTRRVNWIDPLMKKRRNKAKRERRRKAVAPAAGREAKPAPRGPGGLRSFFTASGPASDFPAHVGLGALLLAGLVLVSHYPAFHAGFIWDDSIVTEARPIQKWDGLWDIWFSPESLVQEGHYWPILYTSFWLDHKLWGFNPLGFHAVNLLLHVINTLLVWRLMLRLAVPGAWLIAAVFAVHPLNVEPTVWIMGRKDLMSSLFYLMAVLVWLRFADQPRLGSYFGALALFVMSLLCKSITVTLPASLLVLSWWKRGRVTAPDMLLLLPFFVTGLAITLADLNYYTSRESLNLNLSLLQKIMIASHALWFYIGKTLYPINLTVIYPHWDVSARNPVEWGYVLASFALPTTLWVARERIGRGPLAGCLFFFVTLLPVLGFVDYGYMQFSYVADRYQYLAGVGLVAVVVSIGINGARQLPVMMRRAIPTFTLFSLAILVWLSWKQSHIYQDEIVFYNHIIAYNPEARGAHNNLSIALAEAGRMDEALAAARIAVTLYPNSGNNHANLGLILIRLSKLEEAEKVLRSGRKIHPRNKLILRHLGDIHKKTERYDDALRLYEDALKIDPDHAMTYAAKGVTLFKIQRYTEAIKYLERAIELDPPSLVVPVLHDYIGRSSRALKK